MPAKRYSLWDGGVYDNLGLEPLYKVGEGYRDGVDFLLVSDASARLSGDIGTIQRTLKLWSRGIRVVDIAREQVRGLRARSVVAHFQQSPCSGSYLSIGKTVHEIYKAASDKAPAGASLSDDDVARAAQYKTTLRRMSGEEFDLLRQHGFEVANATLATRHKKRFGYRAMPPEK